MEDEWTLEAITPQKNMARFSKKMLNIFEKYDKPFENSVLVNIETMAYDTPNGPEPWRGEITYPVLDADAGSDQSDMSIDSPQSGAMEMKTPTAVNINEQTYVGTNEQDDPEEQEVHATSTSLKTDAIESTVLPASAKKNETFILSSDKRPRDLKLIISPMTDKRISVALRSMSYLKIDQTYSVNLDCLIEDAFLPKSYELKVTQHDLYKFLQKTKKSYWKDVSCDYQHQKLNKMESLRNNRTFMVMDSPNRKQTGHLSDQSEIHSQTTGCSESLELIDKPTVEEIASASFQAAREELNTSSKSTYSLGDVYSGLVKRIARSMLGPTPRPSFRTRRNSYKSKYAKSIICKHKATDSTILKSSFKTASECSTLATTHYRTRAQSLEYSPVYLSQKYFLPTSTLVAKPDEIACSDSSHEKSFITPGEGSRTSLVSGGSSSTTRAILMPEGLLQNRREITNPPPLDIDHQYEADLCGPHAVKRKTVGDRPEYTDVRCPIIQASTCEHSLAAAVPSNADNQAHEICCSESAGCLCCMHSQNLIQSATHATLVNIPVVSQKTNLPGNEDNIQAGLQMAKHTTCKPYCSPIPDGEIQLKKFDIAQMSSVYLNIKKNSSLKDEKEESNFDKIYRKLCLESNSPVPVLKKASSGTKTLASSEKSNELINSPFYKREKRNSDVHGDDPIVPNGKRLKSRNVNFSSSVIVNYLYGGVNSTNIEKSPTYLHSNAKWL
ncbi:Holliday junction recognition protein isoform X2 [Lissotriton helveticus]